MKKKKKPEYISYNYYNNAFFRYIIMKTREKKHKYNYI